MIKTACNDKEIAPFPPGTLQMEKVNVIAFLSGKSFPIIRNFYPKTEHDVIAHGNKISVSYQKQTRLRVKVV